MIQFKHLLYYDWMHPSWRDLVIEHLQASRIDRTKFLSNCSPQGIALALSSAGGGEGKRDSPLLVETQDWLTLKAAIVRNLCADQSPYGSQIILASLESSMRRKCEATCSSSLVASESLYEVACEALTALRSGWLRGDGKYDHRLLSYYRAISTMMNPLPPIPNLRPYWDDMWSSIEQINEDSESTLDEFGSVLHIWTQFVELVTHTEPRLLQQMDYPSDAVDTMKAMLSKIERLSSEETEFDTEQEYDDQIHLVQNLQIDTRKIGRAVHPLEDRAKVVEESLSKAEEDLAAIKDDYFPSSGYDFDESHATSPPTGGVDVDELFADL